MQLDSQGGGGGVVHQEQRGGIGEEFAGCDDGTDVAALLPGKQGVEEG